MNVNKEIYYNFIHKKWVEEIYTPFEDVYLLWLMNYANFHIYYESI